MSFCLGSEVARLWLSQHWEAGIVVEDIAFTLRVDVTVHHGSEFFWETAIGGIAELATVGLSVSM